MASGDKDLGLDRKAANDMLAVLAALKDQVYGLKVNPPRAGLLGGSDSGEELHGLMGSATDRINSTIAALNDAIIGFYQGIEAAVKAVESSDEEAAASARLLDAATFLVSQPFFENTKKVSRPNDPLAPIVTATSGIVPGVGAALGAVEGAMQTIASESELHQPLQIPPGIGGGQ